MSFYDYTDKYAGNMNFGKASQKDGFSIQFYHIATAKAPLTVSPPVDNGSQATFKAFLTSFKDNFKVNWNQKETFGRMDPIQTYKNTQRQISIEFDVPSATSEEAVSNFLELEKLIMMQYPVYETIQLGKGKKSGGDTGAATQPGVSRETPAGSGAEQITKSVKDMPKTARFMSSPPLLYIKFSNWISSKNSKDDFAGDALVGVLSEVNFSPDLDQGFAFYRNKLIPKLFSISLNISVIHTEELGWVNTTAGTNEKLKTHLFGSPEGIENSEIAGDFTTYKSFPYGNSDIYNLERKRRMTESSNEITFEESDVEGG